jgi:hypothetical protein
MNEPNGATSMFTRKELRCSVVSPGGREQRTFVSIEDREP